MIDIVELQTRLEELEAAKKKTKNVIKSSNFPDGTLELARNGKSFKWFLLTRQNGNRKRKYIPKSDEELARKLALKKYYDRELSAINNELKAIKSYIKYYPKQLPGDLFVPSSEYTKLLSNDIPFLQSELSEWEMHDYPRNPKYQEKLLIKTLRGELVRSKSEAFIADALFRNQIPYRYECELTFSTGECFYPDFTVKHPRTGKTYIWEHFGMMDVPEYIQVFSDKMKIYVTNGFIPNNNLIMTFESGKNPISNVDINETIYKFFGVKTLF